MPWTLITSCASIAQDAPVHHTVHSPQRIAKIRKASRAEGFCFAIFLEDVCPCSRFQPQLSIALLLAGNVRPPLRSFEARTVCCSKDQGVPRDTWDSPSHTVWIRTDLIHFLWISSFYSQIKLSVYRVYRILGLSRKIIICIMHSYTTYQCSCPQLFQPTYSLHIIPVESFWCSWLFSYHTSMFKFKFCWCHWVCRCPESYL